MKILIFIILSLSINCYSQDILTIELPIKKAEHQSWRYNKAGYSFEYLKIENNGKRKLYVYKIENIDKSLRFKWFVFNLRLIPLRYYKYIHEYNYIEYFLENGKMFQKE